MSTEAESVNETTAASAAPKPEISSDLVLEDSAGRKSPGPPYPVHLTYTGATLRQPDDPSAPRFALVEVTITGVEPTEDKIVRTATIVHRPTGEPLGAVDVSTARDDPAEAVALAALEHWRLERTNDVYPNQLDLLQPDDNSPTGYSSVTRFRRELWERRPAGPYTVTCENATVHSDELRFTQTVTGAAGELVPITTAFNDWPVYVHVPGHDQRWRHITQLVVILFDIPTEPPKPRSSRPGRPQGSKSIQPLTLSTDVLEMPSDSAMAFAMESLAAPLTDWIRHEVTGRPEYRVVRGHVNASTVYIKPGEERMSVPIGSHVGLETACAALWYEVAQLGAADMQLLMYLSNVWMALPQATDGTNLHASAYAQARGLSRAYAAARGAEERNHFNAMVHRLASLDLHATIATRVKGKQRETHIIRGRLLLAEAIAGLYTGPLEGFSGQRRADVTAWRLVPGTAWLASRELGQIGRYPTALLTLNPRRDDFLIRLGAYLGHQTAVRASSGTLAQPLTVESMLNGIREPIPEDRRLLAKLKGRVENGLDMLQERRILTSWQWAQEPTRGRQGFLKASIVFTYHAASLREHVQRHPAAKRALTTQAVRRLLPDGVDFTPETSAGRDEN
jgi:hypothetical protein